MLSYSLFKMVIYNPFQGISNPHDLVKHINGEINQNSKVLMT